MKIVKGQRRGTARSICCVAMVMLASGCIITKDVTNESDLCGGYKKGAMYALVQEVALTDTLVLSADSLYLNHYRASDPRENAGIVTSGTSVVVERVVYSQHPENGASLHPWVVIQSGRWRGSEADVYLLSRRLRAAGRNPYTFNILEPDPKYLRRVDGEASMPAEGGVTNGH